MTVSTCRSRILSTSAMLQQTKSTCSIVISKHYMLFTALSSPHCFHGLSVRPKRWNGDCSKLRWTHSETLKLLNIVCAGLKSSFIDVDPDYVWAAKQRGPYCQSALQATTLENLLMSLSLPAFLSRQFLFLTRIFWEQYMVIFASWGKRRDQINTYR